MYSPPNENEFLVVLVGSMLNIWKRYLIFRESVCLFNLRPVTSQFNGQTSNDLLIRHTYLGGHGCWLHFTNLTGGRVTSSHQVSATSVPVMTFRQIGCISASPVFHVTFYHWQPFENYRSVKFTIDTWKRYGPRTWSKWTRWPIDRESQRSNIILNFH